VLPQLRVPLFDMALSTYALVRAIYILLALLLTVRLNARAGISTNVTLTAFAIGVPIGILGAHVLDMVEYWGEHGGPSNVLSSGGSSIYGAFLLVIPTVWLYARLERVSPLLFLDCGTPAMALGEAMTRIGCFLNGCCYGIPWNGPWAISFPPASFAYNDQIARGLLSPGAAHSLAVHPVQLYSLAIMAIVFVLLLRMVRLPHHDGAVFFTFLLAYGLLRLGMAPLRQEGLASMKLFSLLFVVAGALGWSLIARTPEPPASPRRTA
jgi:phosphatidylglycerol:prolipoprotein diacylglycerol transferase